jgi:deoxyguanosine kinase
MTVELKEKLACKSVILAVLGATGVGKTTFSGVLASELDIPVIDEKYPENPFLEKFYKDPFKYSFPSQLKFLINASDQLMEEKNLANISSIRDAGNDMNRLYAKTHYEIGWMKKAEYDMYEDIFEILDTHSSVRHPDVILCLFAEPSVIVERIVKRGRPFELKMLKECPRYFSKLNSQVLEYSRGLKNSILIDASDDNFIDNIHTNNLIENINNIK